MKTNRTIAGFAILVAALLATTFDPGQARAGELNHEQQQTILHEANTLYESGTANATDRALSKEAFEAAAAKYQTLVDDGVNNWQMHFNLGNAYLQSGALGRAIANYERAAAMTGDKAVHANLEHARSLVKTEAPAAIPQTTWESAQQHLAAVPLENLLMVAAIAWACFWITMSLRIPSWQRSLKTIGVVAAGLFLSATLIMANRDQGPQLPVGIITADQVPLREGNGEAFGSQEGTSLIEGERVQVVEQRGEWIHVQLHDGRTGWLTDSQLEVI